jgi:hypothetical protein
MNLLRRIIKKFFSKKSKPSTQDVPDQSHVYDGYDAAPQNMFIPLQSISTNGDGKKFIRFQVESMTAGNRTVVCVDSLIYSFWSLREYYMQVEGDNYPDQVNETAVHIFNNFYQFFKTIKEKQQRS